jgi:hypothetical protein
MRSYYLQQLDWFMGVFTSGTPSNSAKALL